MSRRNNIILNIDWVLMGIFLFFILVGWINIYAAAYNPEHKSIFDFTQDYGKQFLWIIIALVIGLCIMIIDAKFFSTFSLVIYIFSIILLLLTIFIGKEIHGSKSWIILSETIRFQPLEFAKFSTTLILASLLSQTGIKIQDIGTRLRSLLFILIPAILILFQNETGSALIFVSFIFLLYREGLSGNILIIGFTLVVLFILSILIDKLIIISFILGVAIIIFFLIRKTKKNILTYIFIVAGIIGFSLSVNTIYEYALKPHQKKRIDVLLGKIDDPKDAGYNVNQSKIAIGSGGIIGKGFLNGTQTKYKFVPEQNTDFIFCTIGEEWGFLGSATVLLMYLLFILRILFIAERQRSAFSRIYGYGLASLIFFHVMINVGMTIGLAPVVGIPLPFISYGGSSLVIFTMMFFVFVKQDANRMQIL